MVGGLGPSLMALSGALTLGRSHRREQHTTVCSGKVRQARLLPFVQPRACRGVREGFLEEGACGRDNRGVQEGWGELCLENK